MRRALWGAAVCGLLLAAPAGARGDGLPVVGVDAGPTGVTSATERFVSLPAGPRRTLVARVLRDGGEVLRSRVVRGSFTIPAVAYDGSASGLSADARTLVLIRPREVFPQRRTRLAVLDARRLRVRSRLTLRGDFSFDALSPDGRTMYLIEYRSRRDPTRYAVRAYDLRRGRLLRAPIVDPREPDERMRGLPVTRETSADGRWEYTLYDGAHPFVHALDTARGEAACIDLDALTGFERLYQLRLRSSGRVLSVLDGETVVAAIDRTTFRVGAPAVASTPPPRSSPDGGVSCSRRRSARRRCSGCSRSAVAWRGGRGCRRRETRLAAGEAVASACHERRRVARLAAAAPTSLSPARGRGAAARDRPRRRGGARRALQPPLAGAHRAAWLVTHDAQAAEDIAQEAFLAALQRLDSFDRARPFAPWLHRIVVNRAIDFVRARTARREVSEAASADPPAEMSRALGDDTVAALATLGPEQRAVVVLRHLLGYSPGQIAALLELPRGTVNSRLRRALDALARELEP